jgi:hypothetical protein
LIDKLRNAIALGTSPIIRALVDFDGAMEQVRELDSGGTLERPQGVLHHRAAELDR